MNLHAEKINLIHWISELSDVSVLTELQCIKTKHDWVNSISIDEATSIKNGLRDIELGKVTPHSLVKKRYEKWLKD